MEKAMVSGPMGPGPPEKVAPEPVGAAELPAVEAAAAAAPLPEILVVEEVARFLIPNS